MYICPSGCLTLLLQSPSPNAHPHLQVGLFEPVFQPHPLDSFPACNALPAIRGPRAPPADRCAACTSMPSGSIEHGAKGWCNV